MTYEEMQDIVQQMLVTQREMQSELKETKEIVKSNSRAIQAMLDQAVTDRLKREEEKAEHERRMANLESISQQLANVQAGMANLLVSLDEDRPTIFRILNTIDNKVDTIIDRLPPQA
jgi:hypothetical protein